MTSEQPGETQPTVLVDVEDGVATITLNRPDAMNAISGEMAEALMAALTRVRDDDAIRCGILTGAGRAFTVGADLKRRVERQDSGRGPTPFPVTPPTTYYTFDTTKPMIAAVNGYCLGGGFEITLTCDIRIASTQAVFGLPEITMGFFPGGGAPQRLPRLIGMSAAMEILLSGDRFDAARALEIGLVNRVVQPEELLPEAKRLATRIASHAPLAVRGLREVVYQGLDMPLAQALRWGGSMRWAIGQTADAKEGPRAFAEKRAPEFTGDVPG